MSYCIRHIKNKTVYLAFDKIGDNKAYPSIEQIASDIETNYRRGVRDYPGIRSLPQKLRSDFLYFETERLQSMRATRGEVERVFSKMNYKIINLEEEEALIKYERLNKKINLDELEERASDELLELLRKDKEYFETMVDTSVSKEAVNKLFTQFKTKRKFIKRAFIEKKRNEAEIKDIYRQDKKHTWYKLSNEELQRYRIISGLNKLLKLPNSFSSREEKVTREELKGPILDYLVMNKEDIDNIYKVKIEKQTLKNDPKQIQNIVNKIYSNWTGLGKKLKVGN